jgi:ABC-2 type transport system permease protein
MLTWLELPVIILVLALFSTGLAMLLSALFVKFRDIQPIWEVVSQVLFYVSPVIISVETVSAKVSPTVLHLYMLNPLAIVFQQFRHAMINHDTISAQAAIGGWGALLAPIAIVLAAFALGFWVFNRSAPLVAENL